MAAKIKIEFVLETEQELSQGKVAYIRERVQSVLDSIPEYKGRFFVKTEK